jgi:hypothetical protein
MASPYDVNPYSQGKVAAPAPQKSFDETPLGYATNFFAAIPESVVKVGKSALQGLFRIPAEFGASAGQAGLGVADKLLGTNYAPQSDKGIETGDLSALLGSEPIKPYASQILDFQESIKHSKFAQQTGLDKHSLPLAFAGVVGAQSLNFAGGEESAIEQLAKDTDPASVLKTLTGMGVHEEVAQKFAPHIAATTDHAEIKSTLDTLKAVQALHENGIPQAAAAGPSTSVIGETGFTEEEARVFANEHFDQLQSAYMERIKHDYNGADNVISADAAKHILPDYSGEKAPVYHEASSDIAKRLYRDWLEERAGTKNNTVLFTAGGTGAGKSSALRAAGTNIADFPIVYDTNLSSKGAIGKIQQALDAGYSVVIKAVHRDPQKAFAEGVLPRVGKENRIITIDEHMARHADVLPSIKAIEDHFGGHIDNGDLVIDHINNTGSPLDAHETTLDKIPQFDHNGLYERLQQATAEAQRSGKITEAQASAIDRRQGGKGDGAGTPQHGEDSKITIKDTIPMPSPATAIEKLSKAPDAKSWQSLVKGYMYNATPGKRAHMLDYLATPEFVLEKVGLGKGAEMLHDAQDTYRATLKKEIVKVNEWLDRVKNESHVTEGGEVQQHSPKDSSRLIFQYLDGKASTVRKEMSDTEHAVALEIKDYLKNWAERLKLPEDNQISNYITHIFDRSVEGKPGETFQDPELAAIMNENVAKSVYDPFLQKRTGKQDYIEDVWRALDAYVKRASRKEAMDPALEQLAKDAKHLDDYTYNYVKDLSHRVNLRPTEIEKGLDNLLTQTPIGYYFTDRPTAYLTRKIRQVFFRGTLGLNFSSAVRNLTQGANTYAKLGEKYTVVGYSKLLFKMASRNLDELAANHVIDDQLIQDRNMGVGKRTMQKLDNGLFSLFQFVENINRGSAYFGAKAKGLHEGLSEEEAIKYAKRIVRETQFAFGAIDTPVFLNDDVVKTLTQLQSYNIKQVEFIGRMIKQKDFAGLARFTAASFGMLYTIGRLIGMTPRQLIPTIGIGGAPLTSTAIGIGDLFSPDAQTRAKGQSQLQRNFMSLFPAGSQVRKSLQGAHDLERGYDATPGGKPRYKVEGKDALRALVFGPSSLPQAQDYYNKSKAPAQSGGSNPYNI